MWASPNLSVFLVLEQDQKFLFGLRKNKSYMNGYWSVVAGKVDDGESAAVGMIREAKEEIGIDIEPEDLEFVHMMHRNKNKGKIDIYFRARKYSGEVQNMEPEKCEEIKFFSTEELPKNNISYEKIVLEHIKNGVKYSEYDW